MKVQESFVITEPREKLWSFFEQVDQVARCVPGVESVDQVDADNSNVRVTQSVGPMTATFDIKMRVTDREPLERMSFTAVGRAVKGAMGNVRTTNTVRLADVEDGTRVDLEADLAMGGVLGTVGEKVVSKQVAQVTKAFAESLERSIKGEAPVAAAASANGNGGTSRRRPVGVSAPAAEAPAPASTPAASAAPAAGAAPALAPAGPLPVWQRPEVVSSLLTLLAVVVGYLGGRRSARS
jgi:carbon monoxide dehydrogenase subunit G